LWHKPFSNPTDDNWYISDKSSTCSELRWYKFLTALSKSRENPEDTGIYRCARKYDNHIIFKKPTGLKKEKISASDLEKMAFDETR
jgi:hypothetical protein